MKRKRRQKKKSVATKDDLTKDLKVATDNQKEESISKKIAEILTALGVFGTMIATIITAIKS